MKYILKEIFKAINGFSANIIPAIIGAAGMLGAAYMSSQSSKENNQNSLKAAANAHQIEKADLIKAGMNPILTAKGAGAPIPNFSTPDYSSLSQLGTAAGSAMERKIQKQNLQIQRDIADAEITNKLAEADEHQANANAINGYKKTESETNVSKINTEIEKIKAEKDQIKQITEEAKITLEDRIKKLKMEIAEISENISKGITGEEKDKAETELTKKKTELYTLGKKVAIAGNIAMLIGGGVTAISKAPQAIKYTRKAYNLVKEYKALKKAGWIATKGGKWELVNPKTGEIKNLYKIFIDNL